MMQPKKERKKKEQKWTNPQKNVGNHIMHLHICTGNIWNRGEKGKENYQWNNGWQLPKFVEKLSYPSRKFDKLQIE